MPTSHSSLDDARVVELLHAYLAAEYRWQHKGGWHDIIIGLPTPGLELAFPQATTFGAMSAWNPLSIERGRDQNRIADEALHEALAAGGHAFLPAFASARNRSWREPSWLVFGMDSGEFDHLSRRFGQLGTLWWKPGEPVRLRMDACKPGGLADEPYVDWLK